MFKEPHPRFFFCYDKNMHQDSLEQRLQDIKKVIPHEILLSRKSDDTQNIARYFKLNKIPYWLVNSKQGFVHMGISRDGVFKNEDFLEHGRIISRYIEETKSNHVLEVGAGKAATTKYLARKFQDVTFIGLDLPNGQLNTKFSKLPNLKLVEGDYHDLSRFSNNTFDIVYVIEALCYATPKEKVVEEVRRILKPGGLFIIFDGYSSKPQIEMNGTEKLVSDLMYTSMMVTKEGHLYSDLQQKLKTKQFEIIEEENLSDYVLPSMKRLEDGAIRYFKGSVYSKLLNFALPDEITGNAVAAYLMPLSVAEGLHTYWLTVAKKK